MPFLGCKKCHHEWEGSQGDDCAWCEGDSYVLEEQTPLEKLFKEISKEATKMNHVIKDTETGEDSK